MIKFSEECACGARTSIEHEDKDEALAALDAWTKRHEGHESPEPKVFGATASVEKGYRSDGNHELWTSFQKNPIIYAKSVPFGFVRNEENLQCK